MSNKLAALALLATTAISPAFAAEGPSPRGIDQLNHVFVIMMENHDYQQIVGNPYMPFVNTVEIPNANVANNYFAVAHPSQTNYLEVVGGSNFGILNDNTTNFGSTTCTSTLTPAGATNEHTGGLNCPIAGSGVDTATPLIDYSNETSGPPGDIEIDGMHSYAAAPTTGKSIADQLNEFGLTWKTYQESLPLSGPWGVTTSDGYFTDIGTYSADEVALGETGGNLAKLYRMKHNPFIAFASIQATYNPATGQIPGVSSYEGATGLWADIATGRVANYSLIVPNQCHDQHAGNNGAVFAYPFCSGDPNDNGTQTGLNPGLMAVGDQEIQAIVQAIKASPVWTHGHTAIVITWDENDYSVAPTTNQVLTIVDKNFGAQGVQSNTYYTHFSLLKSIESGFGLPCLNHACDHTTMLMRDLFN